MKEIYLAGGCFWGLQKFFDQFEGVFSTEVGYANGPEYTNQHAPSYEEVCRNSGHAETVKVVYDENLLPLPELLRYYFMVIDPVSVNRQGNDCGIQYRTGIYFTERAQLRGIRPGEQGTVLLFPSPCVTYEQGDRNKRTVPIFHVPIFHLYTGGKDDIIVKISRTAKL